MTMTTVLVLNISDPTPKVFHRVERVWWDDKWEGLRVRSYCHHANGKIVTSFSRALVHLSHAKKFARPCAHCYRFRGLTP